MCGGGVPANGSGHASDGQNLRVITILARHLISDLWTRVTWDGLRFLWEIAGFGSGAGVHFVAYERDA